MLIQTERGNPLLEVLLQPTFANNEQLQVWELQPQAGHGLNQSVMALS